MKKSRLERLGISILFVIGGDGTMRGAMQIASVVGERGARIAVVGVPKTIDNDIPYLDQSFGFQTAFARATESIHAVTVEAKSTPYGVGLVKLMGRHSGFIACYAALARNDADVVLIRRSRSSWTAPADCSMSGRTEMVVGRWRRRFVHIPMALAVSKRNQVDPHGDLWMSVLEATGQPVRFGE